MTNQQVIALVFICAFVAGLFVYAYMLGLQKGRHQGRGQLQSKVWQLESSLRLMQNDHKQLAQHANKPRETNALQEQHHRTLLQIAENLRIAAETWKAFSTGKKLERDARQLRGEALAMAELLKPTDQEAAA